MYRKAPIITSIPLSWWKSQLVSSFMISSLCCGLVSNSPSLCNVSICRNTKASDCQWSDFSSFSDLSQRPREGCWNQPQSQLGNLAEKYLYFIHISQTDILVFLLYNMMWQAVVCCYLVTCGTRESHYVTEARIVWNIVTYGRPRSYGRTNQSGVYGYVCHMTKPLIGSARNDWKENK